MVASATDSESCGTLTSTIAIFSSNTYLTQKRKKYTQKLQKMTAEISMNF
jgi:hypothetical protein